MKKLVLLKSIVTIAFILALGLSALLYFYYTQNAEAAANWIPMALWGIIFLTFTLFVIAWKMMLDIHSDSNMIKEEATLEKEQENVLEDENEEDDSLKEKLEIVHKELQNIDSKDYTEGALRTISRTLEFDTALAYKNNNGLFEPTARWAYYNEDAPDSFRAGEGLCGQAVQECKSMMIENLPEDYFTILSGSGKSAPKSLYILPLYNENECVGLIEFASLRKGNPKLKEALDNLQSTIVEQYANKN